MDRTERDWFVNPDNYEDRYPIEPSEKHMPILFANIHEWLLKDQNRQRQINHLNRYFGSNYSGKLFEYFAARSEPKVFTPWDILAVESLSVGVLPATAKWLLEPDEVRDGYLDIANKYVGSSEVTLWGCDKALIGDESELSKLYDLLRLQPGLGYVTTSKLMAVKFPRVVPIRDSQVELLLGLQNEKSWWSTFRTLFEETAPSLAKHLDGLPLPNGAGQVTTLRRLDVILWMEAKARSMGRADT
jgi:hypothetical protein